MFITNFIIASYCSQLHQEINYRRNPHYFEQVQCESIFEGLNKKEISRQQALIKNRLGESYLN